MIRAHSSMARVSSTLHFTPSFHCPDVGTLLPGPIAITRRRKCAPIFIRASALSSPPTSLPSSDTTALGDLTRPDFPILHQEVNGHKLVYIDNAATSQKPVAVLDVLKDYYESYNSNVHRGIHTLSAKATDEYEAARKKVAKFINAPSSGDIVFTRNATEAINLLAYTWGLTHLKHGDEVILSIAEHHSMIVPWQFAAKKTGAVLKYISLTKDEVADMDQLKGLLSKRTKLVALHHVSNVLVLMASSRHVVPNEQTDTSSINPVELVVEWSKKYGTKVLVDACQSVPHMPVDVQDLDVDFLVASSHKMCGPTGVGFLYGKSDLLQELPPFLGGGEMIAEVFLDHSTYAEPPSRFEAGTPAIGQAIGFGAAVDYLTNIGMQRIHDYEFDLSQYLYRRLSAVPKVRIYGPSLEVQAARASLCSFNVDGIHATDIATFLDQQHGVAVRSGHHCTQPLHRHLGINASVRASLYFYNTKVEVDAFIKGLEDAIDFFASYQ